MLLILPANIFDYVLSFVRQRLRRNVISSCKALRPVMNKKSTKHPTHKEQAFMLSQCNLHLSSAKDKFVISFDNPTILELFRVWNTPHTKEALIRWIKKQWIDIDEGGLFASVPLRCELLNAEGERCHRIRVKLWDRVIACHDQSLNRYGDTRRVWRLLPISVERAYEPCLLEPDAGTHKHCLRSKGYIPGEG